MRLKRAIEFSNMALWIILSRAAAFSEKESLAQVGGKGPETRSISSLSRNFVVKRSREMEW